MLPLAELQTSIIVECLPNAFKVNIDVTKEYNPLRRDSALECCKNTAANECS